MVSLDVVQRIGQAGPVPVVAGPVLVAGPAVQEGVVQPVALGVRVRAGVVGVALRVAAPSVEAQPGGLGKHHVILADDDRLVASLSQIAKQVVLVRADQRPQRPPSGRVGV